MPTFYQSNNEKDLNSKAAKKALHTRYADVASPAACGVQFASSITQPMLRKSCELKHKKPEEQKSENCTVRFPAGELSIVRLKAQLVGIPTNTYIRAASLGSNYRPPRNPELIKTLQALNLELTRQGNNINQIAKHLNNNTASPVEADGMLGIIARSHIQTHKAVRAALSEGKEMPPEP